MAHFVAESWCTLLRNEWCTFVGISSLGTSGETDEEKEKNMKVLLLMKNRTENSFEYNSDIQTEENGGFKTTSNVGTYSGAKGTEMWPYMIHQIALNEFKISK